MSLRRIGELQLETDVRFHERMWRAQRIAWYLSLVILAAAVAGLFGAGPLSHATARSPDGNLEVSCERFARKLSPADFHVEAVVPRGARIARLGVSHDTLEALQIERVTPQPAGVEEAGDDVIYSFPVAAAGDRVRVAIHAKLQAMGPLDARFSLGGASAECRMFVYP